MQRLDGGFPIGSRRYRWGITLAEFRAQAGAGGETGTRPIVACDRALGLDTLSAELTAPRADRPVLQLCYQLAPIANDPLPAADLFTVALAPMLGEARTTSEYDLPEGGDLSGSVRYYAGWEDGGHSVGISLYGAARQTEYGVAPGCLWLSWSPEKAAQPFLAEWRARANDLAARKPADIVGFRLSVPQIPVFGGGRGKRSTSLREANYVLYHPELLPTPPAVSALLGDHGAAFWRCSDDSWCASTAWDTIVLAAGSKVEASWNDIAPAKGGGFSEIAIGRWAARDYHGSRPIRDAVERLRAMAGVTVTHLTGYDC